MNAIDMGGFSAWLAMAQTQPEVSATQGGETAAPAQPAGPRVPGASGAPATTQAPAGGGGGGGAGGGGGFNMIWMLFLFLIVMVVMTSMTGRKEKKRRAALMSSMKRGDKVQTTGGIIGTIEEMGDNEVVLRVDEVSKTRIRFSRAAVTTILQSRDTPASKGGEVEAKPKTETANA